MAISIPLNITVLNAGGVLNTGYLKTRTPESINLLFTALYCWEDVVLLNEVSLAFRDKALLIKA